MTWHRKISLAKKKRLISWPPSPFCFSSCFNECFNYPPTCLSKNRRSLSFTLHIKAIRKLSAIPSKQTLKLPTSLHLYHCHPGLSHYHLSLRRYQWLPNYLSAFSCDPPVAHSPQHRVILWNRKYDRVNPLPRIFQWPSVSLEIKSKFLFTNDPKGILAPAYMST